MTPRELQLMEDDAQVYCPIAKRAIAMGNWKAASVALLAQLKKCDMALQSLTPGGSEYVGDPERCVAVVRDKINQYRDMWREAVAKNRS